jgi:DNA transformation protein and related proteins
VFAKRGNSGQQLLGHTSGSRSGGALGKFLVMLDRARTGHLSKVEELVVSKQAEQTQKLADHYVDQLSDWAKVTTRPLFGAVALYRNEHVFAMVWHGALYFKVDDTSRGDYEAAGSKALGYESAGEDHALKSYWEVPADVIEDDDRLRDWVQRAYQTAADNKKSKS